jgi:drug/metabolite transporter (DMT)-like permease
MKKIGNSMVLMLTALIWGFAFVAQSEGMKHIAPFTFNGIRSLLGGIALIPVVLILRAKKKEPLTGEGARTLILGGLSCGFVLFVASTLQQYALINASPGKGGFLTALYIVIVPLLGIFLKKKPGLPIIFAVIAALVGLYLVCFDNEKLVLAADDILLVLSALVFAVHILVIDYFSPKTDGVAMSCIQFLVCGILSVLPIIFIDKPEISAILDAKVSILYAGLLSCAVGYTLQIVGQKNVNPFLASLILSLESVFALIGEYAFSLMTGNPADITPCKIIGYAVVFAAIIIAQVPELKKKK